MPQVSCVRCSRVLEYGGDRPLFCGYCGQSLGAPPPTETVAIPQMPRVPAVDGPPGSTTSAPRGDETIDFIPRPGSKREAPDRVKDYRLIEI